MGINHNIRPLYLLLNVSFTLINSEFSDGQLTKCTHLATEVDISASY
jgi:hypothetical protein